MATQAQQDKLFDEICQQNQNFEHFEKLFQEVLLEVENNDVLETFRREYETLHNTFLKSHEGERRLIKKCMDLTAEVTSCQLKVRSADELSLNDKNTIDALKKEIAKAKTKIGQSRQTEITLKEKIKQLKVDIKELDKQVQRGAEGVGGNETRLRELGRARVDLQKEHDTQKSQLNGLQQDIAHLEGRLGKVQAEKDAQDAELKALHQAIESKENEIGDQRERKDRKEGELKVLKVDLAKKSRQQLENQASIIVANGEIEKAEKKVEAMKLEAENVGRDLQNLSKQMQAARESLQACMEANVQLQTKVGQLRNQLKLKEGEVSALHRDVLKQRKLVEASEKRNAVLDAKRAEEQAERDTLFALTRDKEEEIQRLGKLAENDRKQIEDLKRERDILDKNYLKAQSATQRQKDWLVVKENQRRNLEHQIKGFERHAQKMQDSIHQLTKEAEQYEQEAQEAARKYTATLEEVKAKETSILDEQKNIHEAEARLKQQQTLLETVLNERNLYTKNHQQLQSEINEMKRKFKIMLGEISTLKDEIQRKEGALLKEEKTLNALNKDKKDHEIHIDACRKKTERRERTIEAYNKELHKLNQIIADADAEKSRQKRDHVNVMNERDILGAQLIKRNDELARLYEKIRIQQSALHKGEKQYNDRLRDTQQLNLRVYQLHTELEAMRKFASRLPDLKLLANKTQRELTREQCRVRRLLDECDNPLNIHRWTLLEGSEPQTEQKLMHVKKLREELIEKSNEVAAKESLIAEKEKLYVELRAIIQRQPGPEVAEQLNAYQDTLHKKTAQMKAMKASLKHFQEQVEHYKSQHEEITGELREMESYYIQTSKRRNREDRKMRQLNEMLGRAPDAEPEQREDVYVGYTAPPRDHNPEFDGTMDSTGLGHSVPRDHEEEPVSTARETGREAQEAAGPSHDEPAEEVSPSAPTGEPTGHDEIPPLAPDDEQDDVNEGQDQSGLDGQDAQGLGEDNADGAE